MLRSVDTGIKEMDVKPKSQSRDLVELMSSLIGYHLALFGCYKAHKMKIKPLILVLSPSWDKVMIRSLVRSVLVCPLSSQI